MESAYGISIYPKFVIYDEPAAVLDVSILSQVISLPKDLQEEFTLTSVFISHDPRADANQERSPVP